MDSDIGELLGEGIGRLPVAEGAGPALAGRSLRAHRRRRVAVRTSATGAVAMVTGAAVAATFLGGASGATRPSVRPGQALTAAYVVSHALAAVERGTLMDEVSLHGSDVFFLLRPGTASVRFSQHLVPRATFWSYQNQQREAGFSASGNPQFDASSVLLPSVTSAPGRYRVQGADYQHRTWWRGTVNLKPWPAPVVKRCEGDRLPTPVATMVDWPSLIRRALSCGSYRIVGHQRIDGTDTIKIESVARAARPLQAPIRQTLWVNPSSYLPVRIAWTWVFRHQPVLRLVGDFRWLAPTAANLANLRSPIPAGFHRTLKMELPAPGFVFDFIVKGRSR